MPIQTEDGTLNQDAGYTSSETEPRTTPSARSGGIYEGRPAEQPETAGAERVVDKTKRVVTDAYGKTARKLNSTYEQVTGYGQEHPGQMTLIAFGAGVGVGLLLAGSSRSRTERILPPVLTALSEIAKEVFR